MKVQFPQVWLLHEELLKSAQMLHTMDLEHSVRTGLQILVEDCRSESDILNSTWQPYRANLVTVVLRYIGVLGVRGVTTERYLKRLSPLLSMRAGTERVPAFCSAELLRAHRCNLLRMVLFTGRGGSEAERYDWYMERIPEAEELSRRELRQVTMVWPSYARGM